MTEDSIPGRGPRPSALRLYSLIGLMVLLWAMNFIIGKVALREFPPLLLAGMRTAMAGLFILPVYAWRRRKRPERSSWKRSELPTLLFLGVVGVALNQMFFVLGLHYTSVSHSSILMGMTPVLVLLIASGVGQEKITRKKLAGLGTAIAGVTVLARHAPEGSGASLLGDFFILLAALTFALFAVFGKRATENHGSVMVNTFAYVGGGLMLMPMTLWQASGFAFGQPGVAAWASLFYMAMFPSLVCYLIFYYALAYMPASKLSAFGYFQPLIATTGGALLLAEPVTATLVAGGGLVLAGVYVAERV